MKKLILFFGFLFFAVMQIEAQCTMPSYVYAIPHWNHVHLSWESPSNNSSYDEVITYGGTHSTGLGGVDYAFQVAIRLTPDSLSQVSGMYLTHVKFTLNQDAPASLTVKVWQGGTFDNTIDAGTLVSSTPVDVSTLIAGENTISLHTPVLVNPTQELWIGYEILPSSSNAYHVGTSSVLINDYNNLIYLGDWMPFDDLGWMISGCFSNIGGFNIYRNNNLVNSTPLVTFSYVDTAVTSESQYCYVIESVCSDTTLSAPSICVTTPPQPVCESPIGTGTDTSQFLPFNCFYNYSYSQQLFLASELSSTPRSIVSIGLPYMYNTTQTFNNIKVYLANVNKAAFNSTVDWVAGSDLNLVYDGQYYCNSIDSFALITFDTPFEWDGVSNIVVAIVYNEGHFYNSDGRFYSHTTSTDNRALYVFNDGAPYNINNPPVGNLTNSRNNIRFCYGQQPSCFRPDHASIQNLGVNSATMSWRPNSHTDTQWDVICVQAGHTVASGTIITIQDSTYTFTGLSDNTIYDAYVRTRCSATDVSDWTTISFRTHCATHQTIPYTEDFEGYGSGVADAFPFCWSRLSNSTQYPHIFQDQLLMYSCDSIYSLAATQALDLSAYPGGALALSFYIGTTNATFGRLNVGVMTDPTDLNTFTLLKAYYPSDILAAGHFQYESIVLTDTYPSPVYLAFYAPAPISNTSNLVNLIHVRVDYVPTCTNPSNLAVSNITGTAANLSWTPALYGSTGYTIRYGATGQTPATVTTTENHYMLTGLTTNTTYNALLYSNCANGSSDTLHISFTTSNFITCTQPDPNATVIANTALPDTTTFQIPVNNFYRYTYSQQIILADEISSTHAPTILTGIGFYYNYSSPMTKKNNVKIYLAHRNSAAFATTSDWTPISEATLVYEGSLNCSQQGWNVFDFDTYFNYNGTDNLVVIVDDNSYEYNGANYVFRDRQLGTFRTLFYRNDSNNPDPAAPPTGTLSNEFNDMQLFKCSQVAPATCPEPMVYSTDATDESITVAWVSNGNENAWRLQYKAEGSNSWSNPISVTTSPYTIHNLDFDTHYDIRLCAVCSATDNSEWAYTSAYTPCSFLNIPFFDDFDFQSAGDEPTCWTSIYNTNSPTPLISSTYAASGTNSLYFNCLGTGDYAYGILPRFNNQVAMNNLEVTFHAYKTDIAYMIEVGIMTDPTDPSSFVVIGSFSPSASNVWEMGSFLTDQYSGNGHYLAFRIPQWYPNAMYIDDVAIQEITSCHRPSNLIVTCDNISATLSWRENGSATTWDIQYGTHGFTVGTGTLLTNITTNPYTVTGLTTGTTYDFYVRANCGNNEVSGWFGPMTAQPGSYIMPQSGTHTISLCGGTIYDDGGISNPYSPNANVTLVVNPNQEGYFVRLNGTYRIETGTSARWDYLLIFDGVGTTGTLLFDSHQHDTLLNITSTSGPLTLFFVSDYSVQYDGFEIHVSCVTDPDAEPCYAPTNLIASAFGDHNVTLDWSQEDAADSWTISYKQTSAEAWSTVTTSIKPYTITDLADNMEYEAFVVANCDGSESDESNHIRFLISGINDPVLDHTLIYPNPTTGEFRIENSELSIERVEVYDVYGNLITAMKVEDSRANIDLSGYASGVYFTRIITNVGFKTMRIIKN